MALDAIVDNLESVDEAVREQYKPGEGDLEGKYVLDVNPNAGFALENVDGLKSALSKERTNVKKVQEQLKKYEGIEDPSEALKALKKLDEMADWDPDKEVQERIAAREKQIIKKHKEELEAERQERAKAESFLERVLIREKAVTAISEAKGSVNLLLPIVTQRTKLRRRDDGTYVTEVVNENGDVAIGNSNGDPMDIGQFVEELKKDPDYARAFDGSGTSGSGASGDNGSGSGNAAGGSGGGPRKDGNVLLINPKDQNAINRNWEKFNNGEAKLDVNAPMSNA